MNNDKLLKLLRSTNPGDVYLFIHMLAKRNDIRQFIKSQGHILPGQCNIPITLGCRYRISLQTYLEGKVYFKLEKDLFILAAGYHLSECYDNYAKEYTVIDLTREYE